MRRLALLALLPMVALADPAPKPRMGALLIPLDEQAESRSAELETYLVNALREFPTVQVRKAEDLFGMPADPQAESALERAARGYTGSLNAFEAKNWPEAERRLNAALKDFNRAAAAMSGCAQYCDALAMYAAVLQRRGEVDAASPVLVDLLALDPLVKLGEDRFGRDLIQLKRQVATSRYALLRANTRIVSKPAGARVYLDGAFRGYTPLAISHLPMGRHLLRLERPGYQLHGKIIEVTPDELEISSKLLPTKKWQQFLSQQPGLKAELAKGEGKGLVALGQQLGLDRALLGTVRSTGEETIEVQVGLFDLRAGRRVISQKATYSGDEYGQLSAEVGRLVGRLMNGTPGITRVQGRDPLERRSGMEDWQGEDRPRQKQRKGGTGGDPLDAVSGTEDW